jgi:WD40 repeat protein
MNLSVRSAVALSAIASTLVFGPFTGAKYIGPPNQKSGASQVRLDQYGDPLPEFAKARVGTVRFRHSRNVVGVAYSPDGKTLASAGYDGVFLWDQGSGRLLQHWSGRLDIQQVAFSYDGRRIWLQSAGDDVAIFVWEYSARPSREPRPALRAKENTGRAFAVSPASKLVALGCEKGVRLWDGDKEAEGLLLEGALPDNGVVFSQDGKHIATGGEGNAIVLWDTGTGKEVRRFKMEFEKRHDELDVGNVGPIGFSADGATLAGLRYPNYHVMLWDVVTGKERQRISVPDYGHSYGLFHDAALSPDGKRVAIAFPGFLDFFDVSTGKLVGQRFKLNNVDTIRFSPDSRTVVGATGFWVRQWDANSGRELCPVPEHRNPISLVQLLPDGRKLCTLDRDSLRYWDASNGCQLIGPNEKFPTILNLAANGTTAVCQGKDNQLEIWDVQKCSKISNFSGPTNGSQCALPQDGKRLAVIKFVPHQAPSQDRDTYLQLWDAAAGELHGEFRAHDCSTWSVSFSPDGTKLVTLGVQDHNVRVWDFATKRQLYEFKSPEFGYVLEFTPDSKVLAAAGGRPSVLVRWDLATGKELPKMPGKALADKHESGHIALKFLRDGKTMLTSNSNDEVFVWDLAKGELLREWKTHGSAMITLQLSDDDKILLSYGLLDVLVWDLEALLKRQP